MTWQNKVVWAEGMFLRPQHFQQQERYIDFLVQARSQPAEPFFWGFSSLEVDKDLLGIGKIGLQSAQGVMPDGTPFRLPGQDVPPAPIEIPKDTKNTLVHLCLPVKRKTGVDVAFEGEGNAITRYKAEVVEVTDSTNLAAQAAEIQLGATHLRLRLEGDLAEGWVTLPVAHIIERRADGSVLLDPSFIPSSVNTAEFSQLHQFCRELHGLLKQRGEALEARMTQPGRAGVGEVGDFLLLQFINHWQPAAEHWAEVRATHPERLYLELRKMAGELATFSREQRRPAPLPAYDHDNFRACYVPLMHELRRGLSSVLEQNAMQIELQDRQYGVRVAMIPSVDLLSTCDFVLAVHAQTTVEFLRAHFPTQIKIGPVERIRDLVNLHLPGVTLRATPVAPREIPYHTGYSYFQLDTDHDLWRQLNNSGGLALHISGEFPSLKLELWAIRR